MSFGQQWWSSIFHGVQYGFPSRVIRDQNVWKLKTTWNLCFTSSSTIFVLCSPSYAERVYKSNSSRRHPFFSGLSIAFLKDLSCSQGEVQTCKKRIPQNTLAQLDNTFFSFYDRSLILFERKNQTETGRTMGYLHRVWHSPCLEYNIMYRLLVNFMGQ